MRPRLLALDLDGTVLDEHCQLPMGHALAVRAIQRLGVPVVIATGRGLLTARLPYRQLGLDGPLVCFNGGWLGHPVHGTIAARVLHEHDVHAVMDALKDRDGVVCCYPNAETWVMSHETRLTRTWRHLYQVPIEIRPDIRTTWRGDSLKMMYVDTPERVLATRDYLNDRFHGRFHVVISQPDRMEILPTGITKGWGVERLAARLNIPREAVWAVGDADNDLEMIRWAGHGCAMGQASHQVKAAARHVLPSVDARGLCALVPLIERALAER